MTTPSDAGEVISAIRLGWYMAELRGRNRPEFGQARGSPSYMPSRDEHPLPLGFERTATELRIKAQTIVVALARMLNVDVADASGTRFSERATAESNHLHELRAADSPAAKECWDEFAATIYKFDAAIQDGLDVNSDSQCEGYQLGRGLAECYWALDPASPAEDGGPASWSFLLGATRCRELSRLLGRLSPYLNRYGSPAVAGSLEVWPRGRSRPDLADARGLCGKAPSANPRLVRHHCCRTGSLDVRQAIHQDAFFTCQIAATSCVPGSDLLCRARYRRRGCTNRSTRKRYHGADCEHCSRRGRPVWILNRGHYGEKNPRRRLCRPVSGRDHNRTSVTRALSRHSVAQRKATAPQPGSADFARPLDLNLFGLNPMIAAGELDTSVRLGPRCRWVH